MQFALLGHPLGHSLSPQVHSLLARCTGAELQYTPVSYTHLDVYKRQQSVFPLLRLVR